MHRFFFLTLAFVAAVTGIIIPKSCTYNGRQRDALKMEVRDYPLGSRLGYEPNFFQKGYQTPVLGKSPKLYWVAFGYPQIRPGKEEWVDLYGQKFRGSNFIMVYTGYFRAQTTGKISFNLKASTGASLQFGASNAGCNYQNFDDDITTDINLKVYSKQPLHPSRPGEDCQDYNVQKGKVYPVKVIFFNDNGPPMIELKYSTPHYFPTIEFGKYVFWPEGPQEKPKPPVIKPSTIKPSPMPNPTVTEKPRPTISEKPKPTVTEKPITTKTEESKPTTVSTKPSTTKEPEVTPSFDSTNMDKDTKTSVSKVSFSSSFSSSIATSHSKTKPQVTTSEDTTSEFSTIETTDTNEEKTSTHVSSDNSRTSFSETSSKSSSDTTSETTTELSSSQSSTSIDDTESMDSSLISEILTSINESSSETFSQSFLSSSFIHTETGKETSIEVSEIVTDTPITSTITIPLDSECITTYTTIDNEGSTSTCTGIIVTTLCNIGENSEDCTEAITSTIPLQSLSGHTTTYVTTDGDGNPSKGSGIVVTSVTTFTQTVTISSPHKTTTSISNDEECIEECIEECTENTDECEEPIATGNVPTYTTQDQDGNTIVGTGIIVTSTNEEGNAVTKTVPVASKSTKTTTFVVTLTDGKVSTTTGVIVTKTEQNGQLETATTPVTTRSEALTYTQVSAHSTLSSIAHVTPWEGSGSRMGVFRVMMALSLLAILV